MISDEEAAAQAATSRALDKCYVIAREMELMLLRTRLASTDLQYKKELAASEKIAAEIAEEILKLME